MLAISRRSRLALLLGVLAASASSVACAGRCRPSCPPMIAAAPAAHGTPAPRVATSAPARDVPAAGTIFDHAKQEVVAFEALVERIAASPVVYVGEGHDQAAHHAFQTKVLAALADRPGPLALGMEMFYRPHQAHLDAYVRGEIDEKVLLEKTEWATRWGFGWEMYAPMLRLCREKKIPVLALNAPKEITRTIGREGVEALTPEQRATLPALDGTDMAHRAFVRGAFGAHGASMSAEKFERFYTAMLVWDETMSSTGADWLKGAGDGARLLVVAGNGHIADRFGIPARAARKSGKAYVTIVCAVVPAAGSDEASESRRMDVTYADYTAWFAPSAPPKPPPAAKPAPATAPSASPQPAAVPPASAPAPPASPTPPESEMQRLKAVLEEGLGADPCFDHVAGIGWRPTQQRLRIALELRKDCGRDAAMKMTARAQDLIDRATDGKHEAEVEILIENKQRYLSLP